MNNLEAYLHRLNGRLDRKYEQCALRSVSYADHKVSLKVARMTKETEYFHRVMRLLEESRPEVKQAPLPLMPLDPHVVPPLVRLMGKPEGDDIARCLAALALKCPDQNMFTKVIRNLESLHVHKRKDFPQHWNQLKAIISMLENSPYCFEWLHFFIQERWDKLYNIVQSPLLPLI